MLVPLPFAEGIKAMLSVSSLGTRVTHLRTPGLVTYSIEIHTCGKLSLMSSQTLYLLSTWIAKEWQQLPEQIKRITLMLSATQIKVTGQTPKTKI